MGYIYDSVQYLKAVMPAMDAASWLGISGLIDALSIAVTFAGTGFGVGSVLLGIGGVLGGYGLFQGAKDFGNSSRTASQAAESIAKDFSDMTAFVMGTAWPQISKLFQKIEQLLDSSIGLTYIIGIVFCLCAAVWIYQQYRKIQYDNRPRWWHHLIPARFRRQNTNADSWMMYAIYLLLSIVLMLLILLFKLYPVPFVIAFVGGSIIMGAYNLQIHVITCTFLTKVARTIYAQNVPNNYFSTILVYEIMYIFILCLFHIPLYIYQLQSSFLLCILSVCIARFLTNNLLACIIK